MHIRAALLVSFVFVASLSILSACSSSDDVLPPLPAGGAGGARGGAGGVAASAGGGYTSAGTGNAEAGEGGSGG
jgi:hypothetical protein